LATATKTRAQKKADRDFLRIATFILFDASVYHEVLAAHIEVTSLRKATGSLQKFLADEWERVLRVDYEPVFGLAREVLNAFPSSPDTEAILRRIMDTAIDVVSSGVLLRHDFMGRVYHKLLLKTTRHYYATYYTSIPSAWLLANLAIKTPHGRWDFSELDRIRGFRLIDPACGSGTLLSASYMAIKDQYILSRPPVHDLDGLHQSLVEEVIHGWDILDYASHLTLTTLSLHSNSTRIKDSNVLTLPSGVDHTGIHLGSLDVLSQKKAIAGKGFTTPAVRKGMEGARERYIEPDKEFGKYDLVIMNPPFSRSAKPNRKFGYSRPDLRKLMNQELANLAKEIGAGGIGQAGLGAHFMLLGLRLAEPDGRIAVVIPRAMLSGVSWGKVRAEYLAGAAVEYVVSNYDPGKPDEGIEPWNWSENTKLGEVLIVAQKGSESARTDSHVVYINLWRKPKNEVEALLVAHQVIRNRATLTSDLPQGEWRQITLRGKTAGVLYRVPQALLVRNWLAPCVFADPNLNTLVLDLLDERHGWIPFRNLATQLGVDIKQVKTNFERIDKPTTTPMVWGHQAVMNTMRLAKKHVGWGRPKRKKASLQLHQGYSSSFIVAERPHLSTEALLAMLAPDSVLTTAFWEIRLLKTEYLAAVLLWINSTYGVIQYLGCATSSMGDIFKMKKEQLRDVPIPDPRRLDIPAVTALFQRLSKEIFLPFSQEFARAAAATGPRWELDQFFQQALSLPTISNHHYELLTLDPTIIKKRL
jgi:hypothetical protein